MKNFIGVVLLCLMSWQTQSQIHTKKISGIVLDALNGKHLEGAIVRFCETKQIERTDAEGHFHFLNNSSTTFTLEVHLFGYQSYSITKNSTNDVFIKIALKTLQLQGVMIKAQSSKLQNLQSKLYLSNLSVQKNSGKMLGELLKDEAGMSVLQTGSSIFKPMLHGMYGNRLAIVSNGTTQEGQQWGADHAPEIDPFSSDGIQVIKGASSLLYGSGAMAGAIVLMPYQFDFEEVKNKYSFGNLFNVNGRMVQSNASIVQYLNKNWAFRFNASGKYSGNISTPNYFLDNTGVREANGSLDLTFKNQLWQWDNYFSSVNSCLGIFTGAMIGNLSDLENAINRGEPINKSSFTYTLDRPYQEVHHQRISSSLILKKYGEWNALYGFQKNLREEYDRIRNDSQYPQMRLDLQTHQLDLTWKSFFIKKLHSTVGLQNQYQENIWAGKYIIPDYTSWNTGVFGIEKYALSDKTQFEGGLRYDYRKLQSSLFEQPTRSLGNIIHPSFKYSAWSGNIGISTWLSSYSNLLFNVGKSWRAPSIYELFADGVHGGTASIERGNKALKQEDSWSFNLDFKTQRIRYDFNISLYYNYITNYIYSFPTKNLALTVRGAFPVFEYRQTDAHYFGTDVQGKVLLYKNLWLNVFYTTVRAYAVATKEHLPLIPADRIKGDLCFEVVENQEFSFEINHIFKQYRVASDIDFAPIPNAYTLFNVGYWGNFCVLKYDLKVGVSVQNIFDVAYRDYLNRFRYYSDEMGRNISIRTLIKF